MKTITIALPETLREQGNQFSRCIGMGPDDDKTFSHSAQFQDGDGNLYIITNGWVVPHFTEIATGELTEPDWGADMELASQIPPKITIGVPSTPDTVSAVFDVDVDTALEIFGLTKIVQEEEEII